MTGVVTLPLSPSHKVTNRCAGSENSGGAPVNAL